MANLVVIPYVFQNGKGNTNSIPDADHFNANFDKCNDKNYICTEATVPATPYVGQEVFVTDCETNIAKRVYTNDGWKTIPLADIE